MFFRLHLQISFQIKYPNVTLHCIIEDMPRGLHQHKTFAIVNSEPNYH